MTTKTLNTTTKRKLVIDGRGTCKFPFLIFLNKEDLYMSIRIKDATPIEELQDHLLFAVGNTEGDTDGCVSLGQVKDFTDSDKATVAFTGSYLNLTDAPNLEAYVQMTTLQQNYYTRNQINQIIGGITGPKYVKVEELPEEGENNIIYLIPQEGGGQQNIFDEYVWLPDGLIYEKIGSTEADFGNYYTIDEVDALIPSVSNATITLQQGGVTKGTFTLNQSSNKTINLDESFVQEQADWDVEDPTAVDFIKNKPTIPTVNDPTMTFTQGGVTKGTFTLNQSQAETIEFDSQVQADWEQEDNSEMDYIKNKPDTLNLLFEYDDNTLESIRFYIADIESIYNYFYVKNEYAGQNNVYVGNYTGNYSTIEQTTVEYSKDRLNWTTMNITQNSVNTITLEEGEKVYFRNNSGKWGLSNTSGTHTINYFNASQNYSVGGELKSLIKYNGDITVGTDTGKFVYLFTQGGHYEYEVYNTTLVSAEDLVFPSVIGREWYSEMFYYCTSLTKTPKTLPATTLEQNCYVNMFNGCSSLTTTPSNLLPATTLARNCYGSMFSNCTSLTTPPALPATSLEVECYKSMFFGCGLTTAPELPATTLVNSCYYLMFSGCSNLNSVTIHADDNSAFQCTYNWLNNVAATGTLHNLGSATYTTGASGIPSGWTETNS